MDVGGVHDVSPSSGAQKNIMILCVVGKRGKRDQKLRQGGEARELKKTSGRTGLTLTV